MRIIFFDTETTGNGAEDRLVQLAIKERGVAEPIVNATYQPPLPISIESMAIHHITEKMVAERPQVEDAFNLSGERIGFLESAKGKRRAYEKNGAALGQARLR